AMIKLGVARLPEVEKDNTDRNRTSPFAFTGAKFEFRAVGASQSIAFPVMLLNATVAEALGELTTTLRAAINKTKSVDDAVLQVVRDAFKETAAVRFEGNNYSDEWVKEAETRGLLNLRRTPEALAQLLTKESRACLIKLGILSKPEIESRFHIRLERYVKDMLIEMHTLAELVDTMVLPAAFAYASMLVDSAANAKTAGVTVVPQLATATQLGRMIEALQARREALGQVTDKAEGMHDALEAQATLLTSAGAERMADVRQSADALELVVSDELWPLPKYREMVFPV
ncbi:MAG: glutamine synthetase type III, partial [Gemmatimonadaceae bacterium]|nr:glutamine synthetase type III [Gemmatimonadaceae bacterium]